MADLVRMDEEIKHVRIVIMSWASRDASNKVGRTPQHDWPSLNVNSPLPTSQTSHSPFKTSSSYSHTCPTTNMTTAHRPTFDPVRNPPSPACPVPASQFLILHSRPVAKKPSAAQPTTNASYPPTHSSSSAKPAKEATPTTNPRATLRPSSSPPRPPTWPKQKASPSASKRAQTRTVPARSATRDGLAPAKKTTTRNGGGS